MSKYLINIPQLKYSVVASDVVVNPAFVMVVTSVSLDGPAFVTFHDELNAVADKVLMTGFVVFV